MLCLLSGGNWNNGSIAGVWCANFNNYRHNSNNNVGCRADCETLPHIPDGNSGAQGCAVLRYANSTCEALLVALLFSRTPGFYFETYWLFI